MREKLINGSLDIIFTLSFEIDGLYMTFVNVGTALSPAVLILIGNIFNNNDGQLIFRCCWIGLLIAAAVSLFIAFVPQKAKEQAASAN